MVSDLVSQNINIFLRNTVKVTGVVVFMFSLSWQLSLVTFMGFPIIMMVSNIYGKYYKRLSKEVQSALARASTTAEETISAMKTVRSFANEEEQASGATLQKLLSYTKPDVAFLVAASFFLIVAALGETFLPYYTGRAIDSIVIQKSMDQFTTAVVVVCLLAIGSSLAAGIRGGIFTLVFARLNIRLRNCLFRSLVSQETSFFDENRTGDLISRLTSDCLEDVWERTKHHPLPLGRSSLPVP